MDNEKLNIEPVGKSTDPESPLNFAALRAKGIELAQGFSGDSWSDFNLHDPGVTILEHLSYAITDLAYRTQFDIKDLLAGVDGNIDAAKNLFYTRKEILASNPVTVNDLRKLILDQAPEVYNVWLEKIFSRQSSGYIKGLYKVVIQLFAEDTDDASKGLLTEDEQQQQQLAKQQETIAKVRALVLDHRNLGEDYVEFYILKPCVIEVEAEIIIDRHAQNEEILAEVYSVIQNTLTPPIHFYSEADLFARGFALEEMYAGPELDNGFLLDNEIDPRIKSMDPEDLLKSTRYRMVDPADILKSITAIPGILYVHDFRVKADGEYHEIPFRLLTDQFALFRFKKEQRQIKVLNENNEIPVRESLFYSILHKKMDVSKRKFIKGLHRSDEPAELKGTYRNVDHYFSFQQLFPPVYRLNVDQIDPEAKAYEQQDDHTKVAKAKAKQLKAYLMFFEQILANYLVQLGNVDRLLTGDTGPGSASYFTQPLYTVPGVANILKDFYKEEKEQTEIYWSKFKENKDNGYVSFLQSQIETDDVYKARKNRILDHLMSRFNLNLKKYPVVFYTYFFQPADTDEKNTAELKWKSGLLKDIVTLGRNRNQAGNYQDSSTTASGFETLMARLLYIQDASRKRLADTFEKHMGRFSLQERDFYSARTDKPVTSVPVEWATGSKMELLITEEELEALTKTEGEEKEVAKTEGLSFNKQPISFLKDGLDIKNFRIGPDVDNTGFILIYKPPTESKWTRAGRFADWQSASDALASLLNTLREVNIGSEGFHVVEHILLRPALEANYFGYNFFDEKGHVLLYQTHWTSFYEREKMIEEIMAIADLPGDADHAAIAKLLNYKCWINHWQNDVLVKSYNSTSLYYEDPALAGRLFDKMIRNIRSFRKKRMTLYPGIVNMVNRFHDTDIREDFFHFRMTVVLPAWTARFQDTGFRVFVENLFREHTPAHIKLQFKWLGIEKMKRFETLYFDWRESMVNNEKTSDDIMKSDKLISFINDGVHSVV